MTVQKSCHLASIFTADLRTQVWTKGLNFEWFGNQIWKWQGHVHSRGCHFERLLVPWKLPEGTTIRWAGSTTVSWSQACYMLRRLPMCFCWKKIWDTRLEVSCGSATFFSFVDTGRMSHHASAIAEACPFLWHVLLGRFMVPWCWEFRRLPQKLRNIIHG